MNNYYTLIYLNREIKEKIRGGFFSFAISPHKDVLHIYITEGGKEHKTAPGGIEGEPKRIAAKTKEGEMAPGEPMTGEKKYQKGKAGNKTGKEETSRLIFSANAKETALFADDYRPPKKRNVIEFFSSLEGEEIREVSLADKDRLVTIAFRSGRHLLFKLFSGRPNVFLVEDGRVIDAFKNPDKLKYTVPPAPAQPSFRDEASPGRTPKNQMTEINPLLPRNLLPHIIEQHGVEAMDPDRIKSFTKALTGALLRDPHPRVLKTGDFTLWSKQWLDIPGEKSCDRVNNCVAFAYKNAVHLRRLHAKKEEVTQFLQRIEAKKKEMVNQLEQADKSLERADEYEKYGHLLMAHAHEPLEPDAGEITVENFYEGHNEITIPLTEKTDIAGNAEHYYDKAKGARKSFENAQRRLPKVRKELRRASSLLKEARQIDRLWDLESWLKDHDELLRKFGFGGSDSNQPSSPYRKFKAGKYEIWIGKNARSNDALTGLAHKEDVWLHARGISGSHVVIRMGNQKDYPPRDVLLKAAGYAAFYSGGRGMKTVPVMYTKRKYVRKPKGSPPGTAVLEREEVEMVPPVNPNHH